MRSATSKRSKEELLAENQRLEQLAQRQAEQIAELQRLIFGSKRERFIPETPPEQLTLFGDLEDALKEEKKEKITYERSKPKPSKPFRKPIPDKFPRQQILIEPDFPIEGLKVIGQEVIEELEYVPAQLIVYQFIRNKYVDPQDESRGVMVPALPSRPIDKGIAGPGLLARIITDKFVDHLPLYRQQQRFKREGYEIPSSTLGGWLAKSCQLLEPLYEALKKQVLSIDYLQADETPIKVRDPKKKGTTHRGYHWVYHAPVYGLVFFDYQPGRSRAGPAGILRDFKGWLQTDGYSAYEDFEKRQGIFLVGCMAHARRYFEKARETSTGPAEEMLVLIQQLYEIERQAREHSMSPEQRLALRQEKAMPIIELIGLKVRETHRAQSFLPKSPIAKAYNYLLSRFNFLARYLKDGRLEIDNNLIENQIRPVALGRKNYLFAGSHQGAQRAAMIYSFFGTCKKHGVEPFKWLRDVLARIPDHPVSKVGELLPHCWKPLDGEG